VEAKNPVAIIQDQIVT